MRLLHCMKKMFNNNNVSDSNFFSWCKNYYSGFGVSKIRFHIVCLGIPLSLVLKWFKLIFPKSNKTTKQKVAIKLNSTLYPVS